MKTLSLGFVLLHYEYIEWNIMRFFSFFETKRVRKKVSPEWNEKLILQQAFSVLALIQTFWDNWFRITFLRWFREIALLNKSCFYFPFPFWRIRLENKTKSRKICYLPSFSAISYDAQACNKTLFWLKPKFMWTVNGINWWNNP